MRITDFDCKEVICVRDGSRLGFVGDVEVCLPDGRVSAVVVPGKCRFRGLGGREEDYVLPWGCICRIGDDIILADCCPEDCRCPRKKHSWFS